MLFPLELYDFAELEQWALQNPTASDLEQTMFLLWLSLRRDGLDTQEIRARKWGITVDDVGYILPTEQADEIKELLYELNPILKKSRDEQLAFELVGTVLRGEDEAPSLNGGDWPPDSDAVGLPDRGMESGEGSDG